LFGRFSTAWASPPAPLSPTPHMGFCFVFFSFFFYYSYVHTRLGSPIWGFELKAFTSMIPPDLCLQSS
jgi:hypothetical protein